MLEMTPAVEAWMQHVAGIKKLNVPEGLVHLGEAVELNNEPQRVLSTFGDREFTALVGFVDMRGFSSLSRGKRPADVRTVAAPFISAVVGIATKHQCIIDKTIGDEVMLVMPHFGADAVSSDAGIHERGSLLLALSSLLADLSLAVAALVPPLRFSAGFAMGQLMLARVGGHGYGEWTFYGNAVNAAKRIQAERPEAAPEGSDLVAVGALDVEEPSWAGELRAWMNLNGQVGPVQLVNPSIRTKDLKGVGPTTFLISEVATHDWYTSRSAV